MSSDAAARHLRAPDAPPTLFPALPPGSLTAEVFTALTESWSEVLEQATSEVLALRSDILDLVAHLHEADQIWAEETRRIGNA
ncbi:MULTISPECIES: hypothetical protein [unclassified Corynebacterium]|uniref:hypothetical protein n=1 Tax=unclassified Corynebacterium TaxID=2624378 RepID=UPI0035254511